MPVIGLVVAMSGITGIVIWARTRKIRAETQRGWGGEMV